ncbi:hypothetical protein HY498_02145 [Candidatus Woesearchaeota archaeon]|nr:hypothetical protein [Candidatus Woesearchaeota archaeon]
MVKKEEGNILKYLVIGFMIISLSFYLMKFNVYTGNPVVGCIDSDGSDFYTVGTVQTPAQNFSDSCLSQNGTNTFIQENICINDTSTTIINQCEYGCATDNAGNFIGKCNGNGTLIQCSETDNGLNFYTKGNVTAGSFLKIDSCNANQVFEWSCSNNRFNFSTYNCYNGCTNGSCRNVDVTFSNNWILLAGFADPNQLIQSSFVKSGNIKAIYGLLSSQQYVRLFPNPEQEVLNMINKTELKNNGFFVFTNLSGRAIYNFSEPLTAFMNRRLYQGWNFFSITKDILDIPNSNITGLRGNCNVERVFTFNSSNQVWLSVSVNESYNNFSNLNITSLAIKVTNTCNFGNVTCNNNAVCESQLGENVSNCPGDCAGPSVEDFVVQNVTGENVTRFKFNGDIVLKGTCTQRTNCTPPANSFIVYNGTDDTVAYVDPNGNLCIETGDCSGSSLTCNPSRDAFIIQNSAGNNVAYIDSIGDLCLTGVMIQNGNP